MNPASLAATMTGAQHASVQMALAAKLLRMNADAEASVARLIDAAQQNLSSLQAGVGRNLDISV
jgi:hypothetical protein